MNEPAVLRSNLRRDNLILLKKDVTCSKRTLEERLAFRIKKLNKTIDKYRKDGSVLIFAQTTAYVDALYNAGTSARFSAWREEDYGRNIGFRYGN